MHTIHRGKLLPSAQDGKHCLIVGANQSMKDRSRIRYPQAMLSVGS